MQPTTMTQSNQRFKQIVAFLVAGLIILFGYGIYVSIQNSHFRVAGTNPPLSKMPEIAPYVEVKFNRDLDSKNVSLDLDSAYTNGYSVNGKTLTINFKLGKLVSTRSYTITIKSISSKQGDKITNKKLTFTPKNIAYDDLPDNLQKGVIAGQDQPSYDVNTYGFDGIEALLDEGLTTDQQQGLRQAVFNFSKQEKTEFKQVTLYKASIVVQAPDPTSTTMTNTMNFTLGIDGKTYAAQLDYSKLTTIRLYLRDEQTNALVFDSQDITPDTAQTEQ